MKAIGRYNFGNGENIYFYTITHFHFFFNSEDQDNKHTTPRTGNQRKSVTACDLYTNYRRATIQFNILDGVPADLGEFPHMAALGYLTDNEDILFQCGGSLISERYVLTAAHCGSSRTPKPVLVRLGVVKLETNPDPSDKFRLDLNVEQMILHPEYGSNQNYNDIALIKLAGTVTFNLNLHPACLRTDIADPIGVQLIVTGWGRINAKSKFSS